MVSMRRILVPTDFSELSVRAAAYARSLAEQYAAEVHVVHVTPVQAQTPPGGYGHIAPGADPRTLGPAQECLNRFVQKCFAGSPAKVESALELGSPAQGIRDYAERAKVDLIVIGTHADGILKRLVLGSVSKAVLDGVACPVLMVPGPTGEATGG
jgi:nucleotide-binding universal stress UspA family protein